MFRKNPRLCLMATHISTHVSMSTSRHMSRHMSTGLDHGVRGVGSECRVCRHLDLCIDICADMCVDLCVQVDIEELKKMSTIKIDLVDLKKNPEAVAGVSTAIDIYKYLQVFGNIACFKTQTTVSRLQTAECHGKSTVFFLAPRCFCRRFSFNGGWGINGPPV